MLRSETEHDPALRADALAGLRAYQEAPRRTPTPPPPAVAERMGASLRDYGGGGRPIVFVPSLINPPNVLDLEDRSLVRWLVGRGHRVLLLDWGTDTAARSSLSVGGHVEGILSPLLDALGEPPVLVGYCLGGTMAVAAAQLRPVAGLATIAAPWRFTGFDDEAREKLASLWQQAHALAERLGVLPVEVLQTAFWSLDPARTIAKFARFASLEPGSSEAARFVTLEDWANEGAPIPAAAARELFEAFIASDLPGRGEWSVGGRSIGELVQAPMLHFVSTADRIVPAATACPVGERIDLALGHVGMVVGSGAQAALWEPLARWLSRERLS
jgi:polyhydroxyalkanoate synthase subunit PhaC